MKIVSRLHYVAVLFDMERITDPGALADLKDACREWEQFQLREQIKSIIEESEIYHWMSEHSQEYRCERAVSELLDEIMKAFNDA